jgi:undecaprenyl pyrophosphate phosphatase UppP
MAGSPAAAMLSELKRAPTALASFLRPIPIIRGMAALYSLWLLAHGVFLSRWTLQRVGLIIAAMTTYLCIPLLPSQLHHEFSPVWPLLRYGWWRYIALHSVHRLKGIWRGANAVI